VSPMSPECGVLPMSQEGHNNLRVAVAQTASDCIWNRDQLLCANQLLFWFGIRTSRGPRLIIRHSFPASTSCGRNGDVRPVLVSGRSRVARRATSRPTTFVSSSMRCVRTPNGSRRWSWQPMWGCLAPNHPSIGLQRAGARASATARDGRPRGRDRMTGENRRANAQTALRKSRHVLAAGDASIDAGLYDAR
jgi:hypothetical protein